jgi:muramoyltetrapeptide carboxypeptidase
MAAVSNPTRTKPPALKKGDRIGIVAPASHFHPKEFEAGCLALRNLGYEPVYSESIFDRDLYFAGSVERRVRELEGMFERDDVKAVLCARGGYGCNYLLPHLNIAKFSSHPKILVGYSDITSLLTYICDAAGVIAFHGPMVAKDFAKADGVDLESWGYALGGAEKWSIEVEADPSVKALAYGAGEGVLYGGCLSMLVASLGTPYEIKTDGTILFIEDVMTKPFQIDRMLMHLKLAGKLARVRGIVFGEMLDCIQSTDQRYTLQEVVLRVTGDLGVPIAYGLRSGHVSRQNITLPLGVPSRLEVNESGVALTILERATADTWQSYH